MIDENELKKRRKEGWRSRNLSEYNTILQEIFREEGVPLIIGPYDAEPKNLRVRNKILPITNLDNLRVRNFCAGVDSLEKHLVSKNYCPEDYPSFTATIGLGVEDITRYQRGEIFLQTGFDLDGISYDLNLSLDDKEQTRGIFYKSESSTKVPESFRILNQFIGPKFNSPY